MASPQVFPSLASYQRCLLSSPSTMLKTWARYGLPGGCRWQVVVAGAVFVSGAELGSGAPGQAAAATSFTKQMGLNILRAGYWQEPVPVGTCLCRESDKTTASPHGSW